VHALDLSEILSPGTVVAFLDDHFGQSPLHVPGSPDKFFGLLSWIAVDNLVRDPALGSRVHVTGGSANAGEPVRAWSAAAPVLIERVDEACAPIKALAQSLERTLEAPIRAYLSAGAAGLPMQRAAHDAIVLSVAGENRWRVYPKSTEQPTGNPEWEDPLREGDALYIPRGWWCAADASHLPTLQLTLAIENPTGVDLIAWLARVLKHHEVFLTDVPRFAGPAAQADYIATIRRTIVRACREPGMLERFSRHLNETAASRPSEGSPWSPALSDSCLITLATPRRLRVRRADTATIYIRVNRKRLTFPEDAAQLLLYLADEAPVSLSEFYACFADEFEREELAEFLSVLSTSGIVAFREPDAR